jgi:hypothetical protein
MTGKILTFLMLKVVVITHIYTVPPSVQGYCSMGFRKNSIFSPVSGCEKPR